MSVAKWESGPSRRQFAAWDEFSGSGADRFDFGANSRVSRHDSEGVCRARLKTAAFGESLPKGIGCVHEENIDGERYAASI